MKPEFTIMDRLLANARAQLSTMDEKIAAAIARAGIQGQWIDASHISGPVSDTFVNNHNDRHATGGADAFLITDLLDAIARVIVRKNSGANVGTRRRLNLIEGTGITITVADDSGGEEVDITIASSASIVTGIPFIIDGAGATITTGQKGHIEVPFACTITGWTILADQSGSIVVDIWKDSYANYPPAVGDTITGSEKPTLSSAIKNQDLALSTWTTSISAGDILAYNVDSATTVQRVLVSLHVTRT